MPRLTYNQIAAAFLTPAFAQSTGGAVASLPFATLQQIFTTDNVATEDNLYNYLDNVINRTLFAVRPLSEEFPSLEWEPQKYGDIVRKLTPITTEPVDNREWDIYTELQQANPDFACCTAPVPQDFLATRISGGNTFSRKWTVFRNQMNAAFHSEAEVADFFSMLATERANRMKMDRVNIKRGLVNNAILSLEGTSQEFKALTTYNNETGGSYTPITVMAPAVFREFMIWLASKIEFLRKMMEHPSNLFHQDITGKEVQRHTPFRNQKLYLRSDFEMYFRANTAQLFKPERLPEFAAVDSVPFWQSADDIGTVEGTYKTISSTGAVVTNASKQVENVLGLLFDDEFMGISNINNWSAPEPYNARYGFQNFWTHQTYRSIQDHTENALVITLS